MFDGVFANNDIDVLNKNNDDVIYTYVSDYYIVGGVSIPEFEYVSLVN